MKLTKCEQCGGPTAEGLPLCPDCMRATGAAVDQIAAAEELRDMFEKTMHVYNIHHGEHGRKHS